MRIDGLMSLSGVYDNAKLGLDYQTGFQEALQRAQEKQIEREKTADLKSVERVKPTDEDKAKEEAELRKAVQGFEAYFIHQLLKQARATLPEGGLLPQSNAKDIYEDMLDETRAEQVTKVGGFGLTEALMKQLSRK